MPCAGECRPSSYVAIYAAESSVCRTAEETKQTEIVVPAQELPP